MNKLIFFIVSLIITLLANTQIPASLITGKRSTNLYKNWKFFQGDVTNAQNTTFNDGSWRKLNLPHDWSIEGKYSKTEKSGDCSAFLPTGIGWYRKALSLKGDLTNKKVFIHFEGVYHRSKVYINGTLLGERFYGYSPLIYDLTPHIKTTGENILAVRVDNSDQINSRWYTGSGIYREVWLVQTDKLYIDHWGTTITTPKPANMADIKIKTKVKNEYNTTKNVTLETIIQTDNGEVLSRKTSKYEINSKKQYEFVQDFTGVSVKLWSPEKPTMYRAVSRVISDGTLKDSLVSPFGVRKIEFNKDRGFLLNDKVVKMKGVNIHHDLGCLGAAYYERAMVRRLNIFKDMGINAVRTSHNPHAANLLDLCDHMGFLVIDEAFDKTYSPFYPNFKQGWKEDLRDFIDRDKNHPCIIQWSVANEVNNNDGPVLKNMVDFVHSYEPTRLVSFSWSPHTVNSFLGGNAALKSQVGSMDVLNINYSEHLVGRVRSRVPNKAMVMTEAFTYYRGQGTTIKAYFEQNPWLDVPKTDYLAGSFLWPGIDYLGEAVCGWPMHGWNGSPVDITGYMRPVAYLQKSFMAKKPMVYLAVRHKDLDAPPTTKGHWDWPPLVNHWTLPKLKGQTVRVYAYTNHPAVELTLNGVSKGIKKLADFQDKMMYWDIPYEEGTIRADCGSVKQSVAGYKLETAGPAAKIGLTADANTIVSNGKDVSHVEVRILDSKENIVPSSNDIITFNVTGAGTLLALDNGNLQCTERHQFTNKRSAFYGRALAVVKSGMTQGTINLTASVPGLTSGNIVIKTKEEDNATSVLPVLHSHQKAQKWIRIFRYGKSIRITVPDNVPHSVSVIRANGARIKEFSANKSAKHLWDISSVGRGIYFIFAQNGQNRFMKRVILLNR